MFRIISVQAVVHELLWRLLVAFDEYAGVSCADIVGRILDETAEHSSRHLVDDFRPSALSRCFYRYDVCLVL